MGARISGRKCTAVPTDWRRSASSITVAAWELDFKLSGVFHTRDSNQDVVSVAGEARAKIFPSLVLHVGFVAMMMAFAFMRFKPVQTSFPKSGTNRDQFFRSA